MNTLYRSTDDRKIAGVCAGLADYFDLDPVLFRLAFLVCTWMVGMGLLAYVVLWIMVPLGTRSLPPRLHPRLHLSSTNRKIAGVCGGLGEAADIDPVLFRAAFIVLAVAGGTGILLYVAAWLLMPANRPVGAAGGSAPLHP